MTTIVYRDGWVAADSRVTCGDMVQPREIEKLWRLGDSVFAVIGVLENLETLQEWLKFEMPTEQRPNLDETTLVEFTVAGRIFEHTGKDGTMLVTPLAYGFYAWGSGKPLAYGALERGASPAEAIAIAAKYDLSTGGTIREMQVVNGGSVQDE